MENLIGKYTLTAQKQDRGVWKTKNSQYDQKRPQSQTADNPMAPRGRATQPSRDTRKTNLTKQPARSSPLR